MVHRKIPGAKVSRTHRRMTSVVGVAFGALLASPLIALCAGSVASATDDLVTIGPFAIGGYNDTFTYDSSGLAFDNYTTGSLGSSPFDLDVYQGPMGSNSAEYVFTIPLLFQGGFDDVDGSTHSISSVPTPAWSSWVVRVRLSRAS
jgi:hypothetical protein